MKLIELITQYLVPLTVTCAGLWAIFQFGVNYRLSLQSKRIEATKPFLEKQLSLYTEATQVVAKIATSKNNVELDAVKKRFLELYWGELALVEDKPVEAAMVNFKKVLDDANKAHLMEQHSLALAHACRNSLAKSWQVIEWKNPHDETLSND